MKTKTSHIIIGTLAALLLSCGSSMEKDAKKFAELECESMQNALKGGLGTIDTSREELMDELESKYRESNELAKFRQQVDKEYKENCQLNTR